MSLVYSPSPIYMTPNKDNAIDVGGSTTKFSLRFNGYTTSFVWAYFYYQDTLGLWNLINSTESIISEGIVYYNGDYITGNIDTEIFNPYINAKIGWNVNIRGLGILLTPDTLTTATNSFPIQQTGIETGDAFYFGTYGESVTIYYINVSSDNRVTFYTTREGSLQATSSVIVPYTTIQNKTLYAYASSQIVPFYPIVPNVLQLNITSPITQVNYTFKPTWSDITRLPLVSKWVANLYNANQEIIDTSDVILNANVQYEFTNALLSGTSYYVDFNVTDSLGYEYNTGLIYFSVLYDSPSIGYLPTSANNCEYSDIEIDWSGAKNIKGTLSSGTPIYVENFATQGNYGLRLNGGQSLSYTLEIPQNSPQTFIWSPISNDFNGNIVELSSDNQIVKVYYESSVNEFKMDVYDIWGDIHYTLSLAMYTLDSTHIYLIGFFSNGGYVRDMGVGE